MSRLWIETKSDVGKGSGKGASEEARTKIFWGNAKDSRLAVEVRVLWIKGVAAPSILVSYGKNVSIVEPESMEN